MEKLRFFGLLVTLSLLAFGLAVSCSSDTPADDNPFFRVYTGTASSGQPVEITISSGSIARAVTEPQTGHNYLTRVDGAVTSEGKIRREAGGGIKFMPNDKSKTEFAGSWLNGVLSVIDLPGPGGEALSAQTTEAGSGTTPGGAGGGGGSAGDGSGGGGGTTTDVPATVIANVKLSVTLPSPDVVGTDDTALSGAVDNATVKIVWEPALTGAKFEAEKAYKARFMVTPDAGYTIDPNVVVKVNGDEVNVTDKSTLGMVFEVSFPKTTKKVTDISILTEPALLVYKHGDKIDLTGLVVRLTYDPAGAETVAAANFKSKGISMLAGSGGVPLFDGDKAVADDHGGKNIVISAGDTATATTSNALTVAKGVLAITAVSTSVKIGEPGDHFTDNTGIILDLTKLDEKLFKGFPADKNLAGARTYTLEGTLPAGASAGDISGDNFTVAAVGTYKVGLAIAANNNYGALAMVTGTLTINKGEIVFTETAESDRTEPFSTTPASNVHDLSSVDFFTFANKRGNVLTTEVGSGFTYTVTGGTYDPAATELTVTAAGNYPVVVTVPGGDLYASGSGSSALIISPIEITAGDFTTFTVAGTGDTENPVVTIEGTGFTAAPATWVSTLPAAQGDTSTATVILTADANYAFPLTLSLTETGTANAGVQSITAASTAAAPTTMTVTIEFQVQ